MGTAVRVIITAVPLLIASWSAVFGDDFQDIRLRTGARLFRALLAADQGIEDKLSGRGNLRILFVHNGNRSEAEEIAMSAFHDAEAGSPVKIRGLPVRVEFTEDSSFDEADDEMPAGIFLVHAPASKDLQHIIRFAIDHHVVLFSPHEGHVEQGVLGGLVIEAQVRPYVNLKTARQSGITIKDFFLKVAKVTE